MSYVVREDSGIYNVHPNYGKHCYVRDLNGNKVIKVFHFKATDWSDLDVFRWGDLPYKGEPDRSVVLKDATLIQNICWLYNLAPRVYEIARVRSGVYKFWGQIMDKTLSYAPNIEEAELVYNKVKDLGTTYGFYNEKDDVSMEDVMDGRLVDFNTFHFKDDYKDSLASQYSIMANYGKTYYHGVDALGLSDNVRKNSERVESMRLHRLDFKGRSVLDLGCAGGWFCRYVKDRGADDVLGIDYPDVEGTDPVSAAYLASFVSGMHDLEFKKIDLRIKGVLSEYESKYDYVFYLSMNYHIGIIENLSSLLKPNGVCVFEDNSRNRDAKERLDGMFGKVERVGETIDRGRENALPVYHCYK